MVSYINSKGGIFYLHSKIVKLKGGREHTIYYFSKTLQEENAVTERPEGREIVEGKTGLVFLRKIKEVPV